MTPDEKELIDSVFARLNQAGDFGRDPEALAHIREAAASVREPLYGLTQAVIVQEMGLKQAQAHIAELDKQLAAARQGPSGGGVTAGNTSFLGGVGGGTAPAPRPNPWGQGSVPPSGGQSSYANPNSGYAPPPPPPQQPYYQPGYAQPSASPWAQPAGGGFLRNAAGMAVGVAGGALLAEGVMSMFGGHNYGIGGGGFGGGGFGGGGFGGAGYGGGMSPNETVENVTVNNYYENSGGQGGGNQSADYQGGSDPAPYDPGVQDASYDDSSSYDNNSGGGFDDGGSQDI